MSEPDDPAAMYRAAVDVALTGDVGFAPDFDRHLQEEVWRILCNDRDRLLTWCQRMGIVVTKLTTRQTLIGLGALIAAETVSSFTPPTVRVCRV